MPHRGLTAPDTLGPALDGVTALHLISIGDDDYAPLPTAQEVLARAVAAGVRRVTVLTGTEDELAVAAAVSGLEWTQVRPVEFMANKLGWAGSIRAEGVVRAPFAGQPHTIVDEADVAAAVACALVADGPGGRTYTPTGPQLLTPVEAARVIGDALGRDIRFVELSREQMRGAGVRDDVIDEVIDEVIAYGSDPPQVASRAEPAGHVQPLREERRPVIGDSRAATWPPALACRVLRCVVWTTIFSRRGGQGLRRRWRAFGP